MKNKTAIILATFLAVALANPRKIVQPRQSSCGKYLGFDDAYGILEHQHNLSF